MRTTTIVIAAVLFGRRIGQPQTNLRSSCNRRTPHLSKRQPGDSDRGRPVAIHIDSATPHEVTLVHATLAHRLVRKTPERLIGDTAYESDQLDAELVQCGIELIAPHRRNRTHRTQDGPQLRRYRRLWKMERLFAWLQNYRRIVVRYERYPENFLGMLHLACWLILLRVFMV